MGLFDKIKESKEIKIEQQKELQLQHEKFKESLSENEIVKAIMAVITNDKDSEWMHQQISYYDHCTRTVAVGKDSFAVYYLVEEVKLETDYEGKTRKVTVVKPIQSFEIMFTTFGYQPLPKEYIHDFTEAIRNFISQSFNCSDISSINYLTNGRAVSWDFDYVDHPEYKFTYKVIPNTYKSWC